MAIRTNIGLGVTDLGATGADVVLIQPSTLGIERIAVTAMTLHETAGTATTVVNLFESPDLTSASGTRIAQVTLSADETLDVTAIIGQGYTTTQNIIANISTAAINAGDVNARTTVVTYTEGN